MNPMNSEENQGFLGSVFAVFDPDRFSYVTHGGSTEMSAECSIIERHKICPNHFQLVQISKLGFIFSLWGWASFWVWTGFLPALTQKRHQLHHHIHHHQASCKLTTSSVCAYLSLQSERVVYHHWFACAMGQSTVPAVYHHARSMPAC